MISEGRFGTVEAVSLTVLVLISKIFFTSISVLIRYSSTSAWYTTLISCIISIILFLFICKLINRFPQRNLTEIFDIVMGKVIGKFLSIIFVVFFIFYSGANIREFVEMIKAYILPYTPPSIIIAVFLGVVVAYSYAGIEEIAKMSYVSFVTVIVGLITILVLPCKSYSINNLAPLGGYGIKSVITLGFWRASAYSDVILLAFIINCLQKVSQFKKVGLISLSISGVIASISVICSLMAFEYPQASENVSSLFQLSRIIYISRFFQRIESVFIFIWVIASLINVSVTFYIAVSIFCKTFNVPEHRPCLFPFTYFTFMVTLMPNNLSETSELYVRFVRQYSLVITYAIPSLVLFVAVLRGKKEVKTINEKN